MALCGQSPEGYCPVKPDRQKLFAYSLAALAVLAGAFGAHLLKGQFSIEAQEWWQTAVRLQFWHAIALWISGSQAQGGGGSSLAPWGFLIGILLFSGSLYLMAITDWRFLGAVTPAGGVLLILGWVALAAASLRK